MRRWIMFVVIVSLLVPLLPIPRLAAQVQAQDIVGPPPLPRGGSKGSAPIDYSNPLLLLRGYVYLNGTPTRNATVVVQVNGQSVTVSPQDHADRPYPYFSVALNLPPLDAEPGDYVTVTATSEGVSKSISFTALVGSQQYDVVLPQQNFQAGWDTPVAVGVNGINRASLAYDQARAVSVLFASQRGSSQVAETWFWDGLHWIKRDPTLSPASMSVQSMTYDRERERVVLVGQPAGLPAGSLVVWEWDGQNWAQRTPAVSPQVSHFFTVYDSVRQRVVLIGRPISTAINRQEVWEWNGQVWIDRSVTSGAPSRLTEIRTAAYNPQRQRIVLLATGTGTNQATWEWTGSAWQQLFPTVAPENSTQIDLTYDEQRAAIVAYGTYDIVINGAPKFAGFQWQPSLDDDTAPVWLVLDEYHRWESSFRGVPLVTYDTNQKFLVLVKILSPYVYVAERDQYGWYIPKPQLLNHRYLRMIYFPPRRSILAFSFTGGTLSANVYERRNSIWIQRYIRPHLSLTVQGYRFLTVYNPTTEQIWVFDANNSDLGWAFDGQQFVPFTPPTKPARRSEYEIAYDPVRQRLVLFGGRLDSNHTLVNETWEFDGITWTQKSPASAPPTRSAHKMFFNPFDQKIVVVGGGSYQDYWGYDGNTWIEYGVSFCPTSNPIPGYPSAFAFNTNRNLLICVSQGSESKTWEWDGTKSKQVILPIAPSSLHDSSMVYDPIRNRIVLSGSNSGPPYHFNTTWEYDGSNWQPFNQGISVDIPPRPLTEAAMEYMHTGASILFGGRQDDGYLNPYTLRWMGNDWQVIPTDITPQARRFHRLARNSDGSQILLFGGRGADTTLLNDTWIFSRTVWLTTSTSLAPPAREGHALTYDSMRNEWVLFGGQGASIYLNDTWVYAPATGWQQRNPATRPPNRRGATLTFDPIRGRAVLFGGFSGGGLRSDVWEWDGTTWHKITPAELPPLRYGHGAVYDMEREVVVIVGGEGTDLFNDTWEWDGAVWLERPVASNLTARNYPAVAYDQDAQRIVVHGGVGGAGILNDTRLHRTSGTFNQPSPIATINRIEPRDVRHGVDTLSFIGSGADRDDTDVIAAYRWTLNGQPLTTTATFTMPATVFPLGEQIIRLEVQDDEGDWSPPVEQRIFVCANDGSVTSGETMTLLIYAVADNNLASWLGDYANFNGMLHRLKQAGPQPNVNVVVLYDGPGSNDTRRHILTSAGTWLTEQLPEAQMDQADTLRSFIEWGRNAYPATYTSLFLADHANGVVGFGQDDTSDSSGRAFLTPLAMRTALQQATDDGTRKLDLIFYDGCSFGLFENAAIAAGYANYVIASPNTGWGVFAYERYRQRLSVSPHPRDFAQAIAETYAQTVAPNGLPYTISVLDMAHFEATYHALDALGASLREYSDTDPHPPARIQQIRSIRTETQKYDSGGARIFALDNEDSYVDLMDFALWLNAANLSPAISSASNRVQTALHGSKPFIMYEQHASGSFPYDDPETGINETYTIDLSNAHGLGIFYPPRRTTAANTAFDQYTKNRLFHITAGWGWTAFLAQGLPAQLVGDPSPLSSEQLLAPIIPITPTVTLTPVPATPTDVPVTPTDTATSEPTATPTNTAVPATPTDLSLIHI